MLCESRCYGRCDAGIHLHIRTRYWFSCLDCEHGQHDTARLRTRFTFPAYLSHYLLSCFIIHTRMYAWTADAVYHANVLMFTHGRLP